MPLPEQSAPYWGTPVDYPVCRQAPPGHTEVAIIGAGITGIATALWLERAGVEAVLLESGHLAQGASGRNAGFLLAGVAENYAQAVLRYGRDTARAIWEFTLENHRLVTELSAGSDCHHMRSGSLTLAANPSERESLEAAAGLLAEDSLPGRWYDSVDVPGVPASTGGLGCDADGCINPVLLCAALRRASHVPLHEMSEVSALEPGAKSVRLHLRGGGEMMAQHVVLATNAQVSALMADVDITPVRAQMLAATVADGVMPGLPVYTEWGYRYWNRPDPGVLVYGGCRNRDEMAEYSADAVPTKTVQRHLDDALQELSLPVTGVSHRWAGTMGFSHDGLPLVGRHPLHSRVWMAVGYNGHGMGFAVNCARHLVDAITASAALPGWLAATRPMAMPAKGSTHREP